MAKVGSDGKTKYQRYNEKYRDKRNASNAAWRARKKEELRAKKEEEEDIQDEIDIETTLLVMRSESPERTVLNSPKVPVQISDDVEQQDIVFNLPKVVVHISDEVVEPQDLNSDLPPSSPPSSPVSFTATLSEELVDECEQLSAEVKEWVKLVEIDIGSYDTCLSNPRHTWNSRHAFVGSSLQASLYKRLDEACKFLNIAEALLERLSFDVGPVGHTMQWKWTKDVIIALSSYWTMVERILQLYEPRKA